MTDAPMQLRLPLPPNRANARGHWRKHHFAKKRYWETLDRLQLIGKLPPPPPEPFYKVMATVTFRLWAKMDQGNALNRMKWIEDWLTKRGYIIDDKEKHFEYTGLPKQVIARGNQGADLVLEPIPARQTTLSL